jgi:hypothetical protein
MPGGNVSRGQTVNVSLRGFAAHQTVYIKWKKGNSYEQINHVETSNTGSANIDVHVPKWVSDGATSVRAESSAGNAQTNAVTVSGGPFNSAAKSPTPTPTKTVMATPTSTATPTVVVEASPTTPFDAETPTSEPTATIPLAPTGPAASPIAAVQ